MYQSTLTSKKVDFMEEICILFNFLGKPYCENYEDLFQRIILYTFDLSLCLIINGEPSLPLIDQR